MRSRTTQTAILLAIADRLKTHPLLNDRTVVVSDQPIPTDMPSGGFCVVVAPGPGQYPGELWDAGGHAQATEDGEAVIGCYLHVRRDRRGRREFALFGRLRQTVPDPANGPLDAVPPDVDLPETKRLPLMRWKHELLKLLAVGEPTLADAINIPLNTYRHYWEPVDEQGHPLLREPPKPVSCTGVLDVPGFDGWIGFQLTLSLAWDWDLYG